MDAAVDTVKSFEETEEKGNGHHKEKKKRSRTVAGILALLFGSVGAHKFYQGKYAQGVLFLLFFWTFIPGVLGTIEGAHLLGSDEDDQSVGDETSEFEESELETSEIEESELEESELEASEIETSED